MCENLIGPNGKYPTPFQSYLGNITDADHDTVLVPHTSIGFDDANNLGAAFVEAANAYYGKPDGFAAKNARIAELDIELAGANGLIKTLRAAVSSTEKERDEARKCAGAAEQARDAWKRQAAKSVGRAAEFLERAEAAERRADGADADAEALNTQLTAAEARVKELEETLAHTERSCRTLDKDRWDQLNRAEDAEVRVGELEAKLAADPRRSMREMGEALREAMAEADAMLRKSFGAAFANRGAAQESYVAPDGRVFHVGQRVQGIHSKEFGVIFGFEGADEWDAFRVVYDGASSPMRGGISEEFRRVWDGAEEPDAPVVRDVDGLTVRKYGEGRWVYEHLRHEGALPWPRDLGPSHAPYVEVLEGDE